MTNYNSREFANLKNNLSSLWSLYTKEY
jgi:hypothetical protein